MMHTHTHTHRIDVRMHASAYALTYKICGKLKHYGTLKKQNCARINREHRSVNNGNVYKKKCFAWKCLMQLSNERMHSSKSCICLLALFFLPAISFFCSFSTPPSLLNIPALLLFAFKSNLCSYSSTADGKSFRNHFSLELNVSFTHLLFVSRFQTKVG